MQTFTHLAYTFDKILKTVTMTGFTGSIEQIKLITDFTEASRTVIYDPATVGLWGTLAGNVLTLTFNTNTASFANTDKLEVIIDPSVSSILALDGTDTTTPFAMPAWWVWIRGWLSAIWTKINGSLAVTWAFFQATQPISAVGLPLPTGASTEATLSALNTKVTAVNTGAVTISTALPAWVNNIGTVNPPAITKGTQGTIGTTTQDLKDSGRARVSITFLAVAPAVADTLLSLVKVTNGVAAAGAVSIGVASGKILRINTITFSIKANAAAAAFGTLSLRQNPAGATVIGSTVECRVDVWNTGATIGASDKVEIVFPDGIEFSGAQTLGVSLSAQAITNIISISINGFEY